VSRQRKVRPIVNQATDPFMQILKNYEL